MIWLVGNKGMLGTELTLALEESGLDYVGTDREVSILDPQALKAFAQGKGISWIVNCAAYTAVDKAEDDEDLCLRLNAEGPENLACLAESLGARILHISTDYVFDGKASAPYPEDAPLGPTGVYGRTKAEGEARVRKSCGRHVILRTAWLYGRHGPNFVYTMLRLMGSKEKIGVVADQVGSPTWARDLAGAILGIIKEISPHYGIYHFTDQGQISWHAFALEIGRLGREFGLLEKPCTIEALTTAQYPTKAQRPAYSVLSKAKIARDYSLTIPDWKDSLTAFITELAQDASKPQIRAFLGRE